MADYIKKVCLLGDFAVGKTSLVRQFIHNRFDEKYLSTLGVKVSRKSIVVPGDGEVVNLDMVLWDIEGRKEFDRMRANYLRGASGAILVGDLTRAETFESLQNYVGSLAETGLNIPCVMAANKVDLTASHQMTPDDVKQIAKKLQIPCRLTSAKEDVEVDTLFRSLAQLLVK